MSDEMHIIKQKDKFLQTEGTMEKEVLGRDEVRIQKDAEHVFGEAKRKQKLVLSDYLAMDKNAEMQLLMEKEGERLLMVKERGLVRGEAPLERISNRKDRNRYKDTEKTLDRQFGEILGKEERAYMKEKKQLEDAQNSFDEMIDQCVTKTLRSHPEFLAKAGDDREELLKSLLDAFIPEREFTFEPPSSDQKKMAKKFLNSFQRDPVKALINMQSSLQSHRLPKNASRPEYLMTNYRRIYFEMKKREALSRVFSLAVTDRKYEGERLETKKMGEAAEDVGTMLSCVDKMMDKQIDQELSLLNREDSDASEVKTFSAYEKAYQDARKKERGLNKYYKSLVNLAIAKQGKVYDPENLHRDYLPGSELVKEQSTVISSLKEKKEELSFGNTRKELPVKEAYAYGLLAKELEKSIQAANYARFRSEALKKIKQEPGLPQSFLKRSREKNEVSLAILESRIRDLCEIAEAVKKGPEALMKLGSRCRHLYEVEFSMPAEDLRRKEGRELLQKELAEAEKDTLESMKDQIQREREKGLPEFQINQALCMEAETQWRHQLNPRKALITEDVFDRELQKRRAEWEKTDQEERVRIRYLVSKGKPEGPLLEKYYKKKRDREEDFRKDFLYFIKNKGTDYETEIRRESEARKDQMLSTLLYSEGETAWEKYSPLEKELFYEKIMGITEKQDDNIPEALAEEDLVNYCPAVAADLRRINEHRENARLQRLEAERIRKEEERKELDRKEQERLDTIDKFRPEKDAFLKRTKEKADEVMKEIEETARQRGYLLKADLMPLITQLSVVMAFAEENAVKLDEEGRLQVSSMMNQMQEQYDEGLMSLSAQAKRFREEVEEGLLTLEEKTMAEGTPEEAAEQIEELRRKAETLYDAYEGQDKEKEAEDLRESIEKRLKQNEEITFRIQNQNYREQLRELSEEGEALSEKKKEITGGIIGADVARLLLVSDYAERVNAYRLTYAGDQDLQYFQKGETLKKADVLFENLKGEAASMEALLFDGKKCKSFDDFIKENSRYALKERADDFRRLMIGYYQRIARTYLALTENGKKKGKDGRRESLQGVLEMLGDYSFEALDEKQIFKDMENALAEEEKRKLREQEEEKRRLEEKKKEEERRRFEEERKRQEKQAEDVFSNDDNGVRRKIFIMKELYEDMEKKTSGFHSVFSFKSSLEYVKTLKTAPLPSQVLSFTKIANVVRLEHEKIEGLLMSLERFQDEIEKEAPDLMYNQTDRKELKDYRKVLEDAETLKKKMKERQNDADQGAVLAFSSYEKGRFETVAKNAMKKVKAGVFTGLDEFRKYMDNVERVGSMFPGYAANDEVSTEFRRLKLRLKEEFTKIQNEVRVQEEALREEKKKEEERLIAEKEEKARKAKEYQEKMQTYGEKFLDIKMKSAPWLEKDTLSKKELENVRKAIDTLQNMLMDQEFLDLAAYRDKGYDEFMKRVTLFSRDLEIKANLVSAMEVLSRDVTDLQTRKVMAKVQRVAGSMGQKEKPKGSSFFFWSKSDGKTESFSEAEVLEILNVKYTIYQIMNREEYRLFDSDWNQTFPVKAYLKQMLDDIEKINVLPNGN